MALKKASDLILAVAKEIMPISERRRMGVLTLGRTYY